MLPVLLLCSDAKKVAEWLDQTTKTQNIKDVFYYGGDEPISIDTIRGINHDAIKASFRKRMFVLYNFEKVKREGQNAFLKTLEERNDENFFVIVSNNEYQIVPTIVSRTHVIRLDKEKKVDYLLLEKFSSHQGYVLSHTLLKDEYVPFLLQLRQYLYDTAHITHVSPAERSNIYKVLERVIEVEFQLKNNIYPEFAIDYVLLLLDQHKLLPLKL